MKKLFIVTAALMVTAVAHAKVRPAQVKRVQMELIASAETGERGYYTKLAQDVGALMIKGDCENLVAIYKVAAKYKALVDAEPNASSSDRHRYGMRADAFASAVHYAGCSL